MSKRPIDQNAESKEMETIRQHLSRQDEVLKVQGKNISDMQKTLDELVMLISGSVMGKTKGLVQVVEGLSESLEQWSQKFMHAEKWRERFVAGEKERRDMKEKERQTKDDRVYQEHQKDKEIAALKKSNVVKNWITGAALVGSIAKMLFDYFMK